MPEGLPDPEDHGAEVDREKRNTLQLLLTGAFSAGVTYVVGGAAIEHQGDNSERGTTITNISENSDDPEGHGLPGEGAKEPAGSEETEHGLSSANLWTSLPVVGAFFKTVIDNVRGKPFGTESFLTILPIELTRLAVLKVADKHAFEHESKDIMISMLVMGGLVNIAEFTQHTQLDEEALRKDVNLIMDKVSDKRPEMPSLDAGVEAWKVFTDRQSEYVRLTASDGLGIAGAIAPMLTTYSATSLTDGISTNMSENLAMLKYAERVQKRLTDDDAISISDEESIELATAAASDSDELMNGNDGYANLLLTYASNIQGASFLGDPPNFFYILNNGISEWLKMSAENISKSNLSAAIATSHWVSKATGGNQKDNLKMVKDGALSAARSAKGMFNSLTTPTTSVRKNKKMAESCFRYLQEHGTAEDGRMSTDDLSKLTSHFESMPRTPFTFDLRGMESAVKGSRTIRAAKKIAGALGWESFSRDDEADRFARELYSAEQNPGETVSFKGPEEFIKEGDDPEDIFMSILTQYGILMNSARADGLATMMTRLAKAKSGDDEEASFSDKDLEFLQEIKIDPDLDPQSDHNTRLSEEKDATEVTDAMKEIFNDENLNDEEKRIALTSLMSEATTFAPHDLRKTLDFAWAQMIDADKVDKHAEEDMGYSHAAQEVFKALSTQILAANSLATMFKGIFEGVGKDMPLDAKAGLVLSATGLITAFADNVVAYVFAEEVLGSIYKEEYGAEKFESDEFKGLRARISRAAISMAVIAGSSDLIANGANFGNNKKEAKPKIVDGKVSGFTVTDIPRELSESFGNLAGYSFINSGAAIAEQLFHLHHVNSSFTKAA